MWSTLPRYSTLSAPSAYENPTLNSNNNFYSSPRLSRHRGPLIRYFQCRLHPAFVPLLCHHDQDANRGALVEEYTSLMVRGARIMGHPSVLPYLMARRADGCSLRTVFLILPRFLLSPSLLRLCFRPPCGCGWSRMLPPKDVRSTSPERHPRVWSNFQADDGALLFLASRVVPTSLE